jgi:hypothetical protein
MKNIYLLLTIGCLCCSCATLFNSRREPLTVQTDTPARIVFEKDTFQTVKNRVRLNPVRSKQPLKLTLLRDSFKKELSIPAINSFAYSSNYWNYGVGYLLERKSPKRYGYPVVIYADAAKKENNLRKPEKGSLFIHFSLPHVNAFQLSPDHESTKSNIGFGGLSGGLDYYYRKNRFISFSGSAVADFFIPVPATVDFSGPRELMTSRYLSLSNNHRIGRFSFGYGLSLGENTWDYQYHDRFDPPPPVRDPVKRSNTALGLVFPGYYQLGNSFNLGLIYRPSFLRFGGVKSFQYEHLISLDFAWKVRLL